MWSVKVGMFKLRNVFIEICVGKREVKFIFYFSIGKIKIL